MHAHIGVHVCYCLPGRPEDSFRSWLSFHQVPPGINSGDPVRWEWGVRWSSSLGVRCQVLWQLLIFEEVSICSSLSVLKSFAVTVSTKEILQRNEKNTSHSLKKKTDNRLVVNFSKKDTMVNSHMKILINSGCQGNLNQKHIHIHTWDHIHTKQNQPHNKCRQRHREVRILRQCWCETEMV